MVDENHSGVAQGLGRCRHMTATRRMPKICCPRLQATLRCMAHVAACCVFEQFGYWRVIAAVYGNVLSKAVGSSTRESFAHVSVGGHLAVISH